MSTIRTLTVSTNETPDQISDDDLTVNAPLDEDEAWRTAQRRENEWRTQHRIRAANRARVDPCDLNREFSNVADPIFDTPIGAMAEAIIRLM